MPNDNFDPLYSTDNIYREQDQTQSLCDDLTNIETNITALENGKANVNHIHSEYAEINHAHAGYATSDHTHTGYALVAVSNEFNGEQKFINSEYCNILNDTANGVGCAFKASRALINEALVDNLIITSATGQMPFYTYSGASDGSMTGLTRVGYVDTSGNAVFNGAISATNIQDSIVAQGSTGGIQYRKWNSGKSEMWYSEYFDEVSLTTSFAANVWSNSSYNERTINLPENLFVNSPMAFCNVYSNGYTCSQVAYAYTNQLIYRIWSPYSATVSSCYINIYAFGKWK